MTRLEEIELWAARDRQGWAVVYWEEPLHGFPGAAMVRRASAGAARAFARRLLDAAAAADELAAREGPRLTKSRRGSPAEPSDDRSTEV